MDLHENIKTMKGSAITKQAYLSRMKTLEKICNAPIEEICLNPEKYVDVIIQKYPNHKTLKGYFTVIMSLYKHTPELMVKHEIYAKWLKHYMEIHKKIEDEVMENKPSDRQVEGFVPFDEFKAKANDKNLGGFDRLLLKMYSSIPPMRADFGAVAVYDKLPADHYKNYIVLGKKGAKLVISEYKTSKSLGTIILDLPMDLVREIRNSLNMFPRKFLFTDTYGKPFTDNGFAKFVATRFKEIFNKPLTINILRHSYISSLDFNNMSIKEKAEIGRVMGHSVLQQDRYRLIFDKKEQEQ